jgi:DNA-binding NtrC family response regulator
VAASNRDLHRAVRDKVFREDLYFRLAVVTATVPPLRERSGDIPALAAHFLERFSRDLGREGLAFTPEAEEALRGYRWPGNIRELENCVERAAILAEGDRITPQFLALPAGAGRDDGLESLANLAGPGASLDEAGEKARDAVETMMIRGALEEAGGNKTRAAEALRVNYKRLLARIRDLGLNDDPSS